ncbi:unnamed protein product, partial [Effrenium voratum]
MSTTLFFIFWKEELLSANVLRTNFTSYLQRTPAVSLAKTLPRRLLVVAVVEAIALLATLVFSCPNLDWSPIDHLETFAGQCAVTKAEWQAGRKAVPFEILVGGDCMDFCSPAGFANAVYQTLRTSPGGGALHAPVCSTWVFMSRGSTLRSPTRPLGRGDSQKVADGNLHVARCAVLCILAAAKRIFWLLEQPSTSIMETHPSFQKMLKILHVRKLIFDMKDFGANTQKRTILYSSHEEVDDLLLHKHPRKRFGHALSAVRTKNLKKIKAKAKKFLRDAKVKGGEVDRNRRSNAHWVKHAKLMPVFEYLAGEMPRLALGHFAGKRTQEEFFKKGGKARSSSPTPQSTRSSVMTQGNSRESSASKTDKRSSSPTQRSKSPEKQSKSRESSASKTEMRSSSPTHRSKSRERKTSETEKRSSSIPTQESKGKDQKRRSCLRWPSNSTGPKAAQQAEDAYGSQPLEQCEDLVGEEEENSEEAEDGEEEAQEVDCEVEDEAAEDPEEEEEAEALGGQDDEESSSDFEVAEPAQKPNKVTSEPKPGAQSLAVVEQWFYMRAGREVKRTDATVDEATMSGTADLDSAMVKALTDEDDGLMAAGALPAVHAQGGQKDMLEALQAPGETVAVAKKKPKPKAESGGSELAKPKSPQELAAARLADLLVESTSARKKSMTLGATEFAGELAAQLLNHAETLEKTYKELQAALATNNTDKGFYTKVCRTLDEKCAWFVTAEAAADSILAGLKRAEKKRNKDKDDNEKELPA